MANNEATQPTQMARLDTLLKCTKAQEQARERVRKFGEVFGSDLGPFRPRVPKGLRIVGSPFNHADEYNRRER